MMVAQPAKTAAVAVIARPAGNAGNANNGAIFDLPPIVGISAGSGPKKP